MNRSIRRTVQLGLLAGVLAAGSGCIGEILIPSSRVTGEYPAHVFCMRGLTNMFSIGMDGLNDRLTHKGVDSRVVAHGLFPVAAEYLKGQNRNGSRKPIILVGHSYGADDALRTAHWLNGSGIPVDLVVTIDPVTPPAVPPNVAVAYNVYWSQPLFEFFPFLRGTRIWADDESKTKIVNFDVRTQPIAFNRFWMNHYSIEDYAGVHDMVEKQIFQTINNRPKLPPEAVSVRSGP